MQKTVMILALFLMLTWSGADAQAGRGNGNGRGRGEGRGAKAKAACSCEEGKKECAEADTCPECGADMKNEAIGEKKNGKKAKKKSRGGKNKGKKAKKAKGRSGCEGNGGGGCGGCEGREQGRGRGECRGNGNGRGRGNGQGRGYGQGRGNGQGRGDGQGKGQGQGKKGGECDCGEDAKGKGNGNGKGKGGACGLTDTDTPAKPASKEYLARLQATLEEEIYARDYYRAAYEALDGFRRFGNLARAEQHHADAVSAAIERLGGKPDAKATRSVTAPASVAAADAECTVIEKKVIEIYVGLITDCPDAAVKASLERIQEANRRHLSAVSR